MKIKAEAAIPAVAAGVEKPDHDVYL